VVTLTADRFVNKGPGRPVFNESLRVRALAALACVDYVIVVPYPAAVEAIECVRPHIYCKGREYKRAAVDVTGNIRNDVTAVQRLGGRVRYVGSVVSSSTKLLNRFFGVYPPDARTFFLEVAAQYPFERIRRRIEAWPSVPASGKVSAALICLDEPAFRNALGGKKTGDEITALRHLARRRHVRRIILLRHNLTAVGLDSRGTVCRAPAFQDRQRLSGARSDIFTHVARLGTAARLPLAPCLFVALMAVNLIGDRQSRIDCDRLLKGCEAALSL